jgi:hypothetical protein
MSRLAIPALGLALAAVVPATLRAQGAPITFRVAVPVQATHLHPDLADWWVTCNVSSSSVPRGVTPAGVWGDKASEHKSIVGGSIQDTAYVTFSGRATPDAVGKTFDAYCRLRVRLSSTAPAPANGITAQWLDPLAADPRFRSVAAVGVSATATIPAAQ